MKSNCLICNCVFNTYPSLVRRGGGKYCSRKCYYKIKLGKVREGHNRYKNGKTKTSSGYTLILNHLHPFRNNNNYVREHRLVVEKMIGRYLTKKEIVHHLGKKTDNRPHMLMAFINDFVHRKFHKNPSKVKPKETIFDGTAGGYKWDYVNGSRITKVIRNNRG